ncbi:MAG: NAD(P)H-binding protein [Candidatus Aminicenantes bacterium]|nr:NAD(P)H-binding protein [Candidatus Aminicenantes bacterium]MDH5745204.1 NAD(P)H-binding protein [Candidatus Aminicenantes bacterium]
MKVLLTGATGYIGRRLKERLLEDKSLQLRLFVRNERKIRDKYRDRMEIFEGSTFDRESLRKALEGIDVAYYLIHSMGTKGDFRELDRLSAENFLNACIDAKVQRIIYLGGLGRKDTASKHLLSRIETGEILSSRPESIQTIWFRAGIIIGSGSASFEIIRNLVQKLPMMITPRWVHTKTQPIGISDVLEYLFQAKDLDTKKNLVVDIGSDQMSFKEMLIRASKVIGLRRLLIPVPLLTPRLSSYWLILITPVSFRIAKALVEGLKSETVIQNDNAKRFFPKISLLSYEDAIKIALREIEKK